MTVQGAVTPAGGLLVCPVCGAEWVLTADEREWFESRRMTLPRRCHTCRDNERRRAEDLERQIKASTARKATGRIRSWDARRGFGWATIDGNASEDVFVHISAVRASKNLRAGSRVEFYVVESDRAPGKTCAARVVVLAEAEGART